jgi:hypothetical protein
MWVVIGEDRCVLNPEVVATMMARPRRDATLEGLTRAGSKSPRPENLRERAGKDQGPSP